MTNLILSTLMVGIYGVLFLGFFRGGIAIRSYWKTRMAVTVLLMMATGFVSHQGMSTLGLVVFFVTVCSTAMKPPAGALPSRRSS